MSINLDLRGLEKTKQRLERLGSTRTEVGLWGEQAEKALALEYGAAADVDIQVSEDQPARPWFFQAFRGNQKPIKLMFDHLVETWNNDRAPEAFGFDLTRMMEEHLRSQDFPGASVPLSDFTIREKGHDLVGLDTDEMLKSFEFRIHR